MTVRATLGMCILARTTTRIRRHADKYHKKQDPKMRTRTNLRVVYHFASCLWTCSEAKASEVREKLQSGRNPKLHT